MPSKIRVRQRALQPLLWVWSHKLKSAGYFFTTLVLAYAVLFVLVSCAKSPTDKQITLADQRVLAYNEYPGVDTLGAQVVLIHGAPADANAWNKTIERVGEIQAGKVFVVDRLGYGNSTEDDELTLAGHAASIAPLLTEVEEQKSILVGHSYGGPVALRLATDHPDKVGGVVLVAGACDAYMNDAQWFRKAVDGVSIVVPEPWARANRELLALTDENRAMEPLLTNVTCPVYIVHGTWDGVCPHDSTIAYLQSRLVNAQAVEVLSLQRAGHNLQLSHIDKVIATINQAIDQQIESDSSHDAP